MAIGFPVKANYAAGDILTAAQMNDLSGTLNYMDPTAKGDLFPASSGTALTRLAIGAVNGMVLQVDSTAATGMKWDYDKVVQIVYGTTTTSASSSTNTLVDTTLTATITPKSSSNKVLVFVTQNGVQKTTNDTGVVIQLQRAGTGIGNLSVWAGYTNLIGTNTIGSVSGMVLDTPATTSATIYKTQFYSTNNTAAAVVQFGSTPSSIILMEVTP
jgi:hypothetical protein